jgi:hypothetical protein
MAPMSSSPPSVPLKWYYRPLWVVLLLFVVLGPFGLPYLWKSPGFSRNLKIVLTVLVVAYTALLIDETFRVVGVISNEISDIGTF